ncbi:hypothetical protein A2U01_0010296 [Trifolium medium]|uniref:Uncharacterized protein n=1 Tax=Trifolium medium TaxID=97028 RepID=A0A392MPG5_9FABA|nr:hypothetical protein [Trifolium medium]
MENIASGFVMLLENAIANVVVMLIGITEVAVLLGILDGSSDLLLAGAMIDHVGTSVNLKKSNCKLSLKSSESEVVQRIQSFEIDTSSSQQWDHGGINLIFKYYCIRRVLGQLCGWMQEASNFPCNALQRHLACAFGASLQCVVAAAVFKKLHIWFLWCQTSCSVEGDSSGWEGYCITIQFPYLSLEDKAVFLAASKVRFPIWP